MGRPPAMGAPVDPRWPAPPEALERAAAAPVTLVLGENDAGKTSLVLALANALAGAGLRVGVVDADVGQSVIGPPTTVGLGRIDRPVARLADAPVVALRFVGATSPARDPLATVIATRRLLDRARADGAERVIVDTSGLVRGDLGRRLKQAKIDAVDPDLVIALERDGECAPILQSFARARRPSILRVAVSRAIRRRNPEQRRRYREQALAQHLAGARSIALDLTRVVLRAPALFAGAPLAADELLRAGAEIGAELVWGERHGGEIAVVSRAPLDDARARALSRRLGARGLVRHALDELEGVLAGLEDETLETLGLGIVDTIDFPRARLTVTTRVSPELVTTVPIGRERYVLRGNEPGGPP